VYGYCRVSTAEQADEGTSLDSQRQQITGYAMMKGWEVADFFVEAGVSGSIPLADRPEGQRLLQSLRSGDVIVTSKLDRAFHTPFWQRPASAAIRVTNNAATCSDLHWGL
jgi:putative DNA-invertase from lambdoid prophage Rac